MDVEVWKSTASNVEARHLQLQNTVENLHVELEGWKEKHAAAIDEERITKTLDVVANSRVHPTRS